MIHRVPVKKPRKKSVDQALVHNLVELQKIHTNLLEKMNKVSDQLTELLVIFETAAKNFTVNNPQNTEKDKEFLQKVDLLLDQNKTLAKGLTIMEEKIRNNSSQTMTEESINSETKPLPRF